LWSQSEYGIRHVMDNCDNNSSYNNHNSITKGGICDNSDWSHRNGTTTARITHAV
jgi:hypothetical protein